MNIKYYNNFNLKKRGKKNINKIFSNLFNDIKNDRKTLNLLNKDYKFNFKINELKRFKKFKKIAVIGMGGSILGAEAIFNFLELKIKKKIYFFNNLNQKKIIDFRKKEKLSKVLFIVVSKSGETTETLTNTFLLKILKKNSSNVIIISEKNNKFLHSTAKKLNLFLIEHKKNIGGRYSVLSEVGVVPAFLMGVNITRLRANIRSWLKTNSLNFLKNSSVDLSNIMSSGKFLNLVFLNYSPKLEKFLYWCQQLIAESLGKKGKGFFPVISSAPKDHHSLLQLYLDGPKDKIIYVFSESNTSAEKIKIEKEVDRKHHLNKQTLQNIKIAQKKALIKALKNNGTPFREFIINKNNEETLGELFSYFILETIIIGKLSNINPFDQPAVEEVKVYTKQYLLK